MPGPEAELTFVLAGGVAVRASAVERVLTPAEYTGTLVDLRPLLAPAERGEDRVLVVGRESGERGLRVRGELRLVTVLAAEVLPLPAAVGAQGALSHVLAPGGVPRWFVLDLARLEDLQAADGTALAPVIATTET